MTVLKSHIVKTSQSPSNPDAQGQYANHTLTSETGIFTMYPNERDPPDMVYRFLFSQQVYR